MALTIKGRSIGIILLMLISMVVGIMLAFGTYQVSKTISFRSKNVAEMKDL